MPQSNPALPYQRLWYAIHNEEAKTMSDCKHEKTKTETGESSEGTKYSIVICIACDFTLRQSAESRIQRPAR